MFSKAWEKTKLPDSEGYNMLLFALESVENQSFLAVTFKYKKFLNENSLEP